MNIRRSVVFFSVFDEKTFFTLYTLGTTIQTEMRFNLKTKTEKEV